MYSIQHFYPEVFFLSFLASEMIRVRKRDVLAAGGSGAEVCIAQSRALGYESRDCDSRPSSTKSFLCDLGQFPSLSFVFFS